MASSGLDAVVDRAGQSKDTVVLVGGEPLLEPQTFELSKRAIAAGAREVVVQTNGRLLADQGVCEQLRDSGTSVVDVSLFGSSPPMHDFHTRVEGSFVETIRGISNAASVGLKVGVSVVLTRSNFRNLSDIAGVAKRVGASALHVTVVKNVGSACSAIPPLTPVRELVDPYLRSAVVGAVAEKLSVVVEGRSNDRAWSNRFAGVVLAEEPVELANFLFCGVNGKLTQRQTLRLDFAP